MFCHTEAKKRVWNDNYIICLVKQQNCLPFYVCKSQSCHFLVFTHYRRICDNFHSFIIDGVVFLTKCFMIISNIYKKETTISLNRNFQSFYFILDYHSWLRSWEAVICSKPNKLMHARSFFCQRAKISLSIIYIHSNQVKNRILFIFV